MANFNFVQQMASDCQMRWSNQWALGFVSGTVRMYLRGEITREQFTATFACFEMAKNFYFELLNVPNHPRVAMRETLIHFGLSVPSLPDVPSAPSPSTG